MGGGGNVNGIATYTCYPDLVRDRGCSYTNTFDVSIPAVAQEKPAETDTRLWVAADKKLTAIINGCPKGKTLTRVERTKDTAQTPPEKRKVSFLHQLGRGILEFFSQFTKNAVEGYATLHPLQRSYDH